MRQNDTQNSALMSTLPGFAEVRSLRAHFTSFAFEPHAHAEYVLGAVQDGVQRYSHRFGESYLQPGGLFTINPDEIHSGAPALQSGYAYRVVYVPQQTVLDAFADVPGADHPRYFLRPEAHDPELARRFSYTMSLFDADYPENRLEVESHFVACLREFFTRHAVPDDAEHVGANLRLASRLKCFLYEHAAEGVSLDELAQEAGLSKYHVLRTFKAATGIAPHAFLNQCRVGLARQALEKGHSLTEAALAAGFSDQSHLSRRFKALVGMSPGQYRRQLAR